MTVEQKTMTGAADSTIRRVITFAYGPRGTTIDTTLSVARTLAPISERTIKPGGSVEFDVNADTVVGRIVLKDSARTIHDTLPGPAFNSTDLEFVVRSLPLALTYRERIPIYDPERGGYRFAQVRVTGRTPAGDAWLVSVNDRDVSFVYEVSVATRELIASRILDAKTGVEYSMTAASH